MSETRIAFRDTLDHERDVVVEGVLAEDYNGELVGTLLVSGYPCVIVERDTESSHAYAVLYPATSAHRQAWADALWHLGEVEEADYERFVYWIGTAEEEAEFNRLGELGDGHGVCGLVDRLTEVMERVL